MTTLATPGPENAVVVDTRRSPHARQWQAGLGSVVITDTFWRQRRDINHQVMLPAQYALCEETGRIDNFRRASGRKTTDFKGYFFNDSDVYKWLEAAALSLGANPDPALENLMDTVIDEIAAAQRPDGYLNTYFTFERADQRWTNFDLHEMYCAGHLIQAAVAYFRVAGKTRLLEVARRLADHICDWFGPVEQGKHFGADGHPEIEMALVELYRVTGEPKYLDQARYFVEARGTGKLFTSLYRSDPGYYQDHIPFRQFTRLVGHAVRAVYLNCGAADIVAETGDPDLAVALGRMWQNMTTRQMYLNGGLGSRYENEGFGQDYELPNGRAHTETCASIANFMWNWRMLMLEPDARYADVMELTLYNSVLSGASLDGRGYFYQNPLMDDGSHRRERWFTVSCCPSNVSRLLASLPSYLYSLSSEGIWVQLFAANQSTLRLADGRQVRLEQRTRYPWDGLIEIEVRTASQFGLFVRLPGWCAAGWKVELNGSPVDYQLTDGRYVRIERAWQTGDIVRLHLPLAVQRVDSHPNVVENQGRVAVMRGPLLYCVEGVDHPGVDVRQLTLADGAQFSAQFVPDLLGGVTVLRTTASLLSEYETWAGQLYRPHSASPTKSAGRSVTMTAVPYFAWANREAGPMLVWLRSVSA